MTSLRLLAVLNAGFKYARIVQEADGERETDSKVVSCDRPDCRPILETRTAKSGGHPGESTPRFWLRLSGNCRMPASD